MIYVSIFPGICEPFSGTGKRDLPLTNTITSAASAGKSFGSMNTAKLEKLLHILLPCLFVICWLVALVGAVYCYKTHNTWVIGDWLINYHGGFVRRGLTGEIAIGLAWLSSLNVGVIVVIMQLLCYYLYFAFSYLLLRKTFLLPYAMLIISPFIFTFHVNEYGGGYRKEIIYFALLSFLAWSKCSLRQDLFERIFFIVLPSYALAVLSHEMLILFVPYLLILYIIGSKPSSKQYCLLAFCLIPALVSFMLCLHFKGTFDQVEAIFDSLEKMNYAMDRMEEGAITYLTCSAQYNMDLVHARLGAYIASYLMATALALAAFLPIHNTLRTLFTDKLVTILFCFSLAGTVILAIVATDWGRFIHIHLVSLFILALVVDKIIQRQEQLVQTSTMPALAVFLVVIWALGFHIPYYFSPGPEKGNVTIKNIKEVNYLNYLGIVVKKLRYSWQDESIK